MTSDGPIARLEQILATADAGDVMTKLHAMLDALPPDETSAKDQHLRATIEAFIAGYEHGGRPPTTK